MVASRSAKGPLLRRFAGVLEPVLGVRPDIADVPELFRVLYRAAAREKLLAIVDEFPYLLGRSAAEIEETLSQIQAVMEEEADGSRLKLLLCGSSVDQMEKLQAERSPLYGRLVSLELPPLTFPEARHFLPSLDVEPQLLRYSIAGGSPLYLDALVSESLEHSLTRQIVDPRSPLFNEPRVLLTSELRDPATFFSILAALADNPQNLANIGKALRVDPGNLSPQLERLQELRLVSRRLPVGARREARVGQYWSDDPFFRFWFRFIEPYQADLEGGADPLVHTRIAIMPHLHDHVAFGFEELVRQWIRQTWSGRAPVVGSWWGEGVRRPGTPSGKGGEEIDAVGLDHRRVVVVGEAKWTKRAVGMNILDDLLTHKIPALAHAGLIVASRPEIVLASRNGFTEELIARGTGDPELHLLDARALLMEIR
jgi:hypothetical protein